MSESALNGTFVSPFLRPFQFRRNQRSLPRCRQPPPELPPSLSLARSSGTSWATELWTPRVRKGYRVDFERKHPQDRDNTRLRYSLPTL